MQNMIQKDLEHTRSQVEKAVEDILQTHARPEGLVDQTAAASIIAQFVFRDVETVSDSMRYEWFYGLVGKAVTIAQAWKQNFAAELKSSEETDKSLIAYIEKTYGVNFADFS